ncbi:MAG: carbohydrate binding domain-containing protein [Bacteroidota bacterium]
MLLLFGTGFLLAQTTCSATYQDDNGLVVIEMENASSLPAGWEIKTEEPGYTTDGYITWTGQNFFGSPGNFIIEYDVEITKTGVYRFEWRSQAGFNNTTEENDSWLKILGADAFYGERNNGSIVRPRGVCTNDCPEGSGGNGWFKVYINRTDWAWGGFTSDNDPHAIYARFDTPGVKTLQVAARSHDHLIDRMILYHSDVAAGTARSLDRHETLCDGGDPPVLAVTDLTISPEELILFPEETVVLNTFLTPANASNRNLNWTTGDSTIATVSETGVIIALAEGQTFVVATSEDGGFTDTSFVTVAPDPAIGTDTLYAIHDAYLEEGVGFNTGELLVDTSGRTTYLMFDLSEVTDQLTGATLYLGSLTNSDGGPLTVSLGDSNDWTEDALTASNAPASAAMLGVLDTTFAAGQAYGWTLDTASLTAGGMLSLVITQTSGDTTAFASDENGTDSLRPVLVLNTLAVSSGNLVLNWDFEEGELAAWNSWGGGALATENQYAGDFAGTVTGMGAVFQVVEGLRPNTTYTINAWVRVSGPGQSVNLGVKNHDGPELAMSITETEFVNKSITFTTGPSGVSAQMYLFSPNNNTVAFGDNFSMVIGEEPLVLVSARNRVRPVPLPMLVYPNPVGGGWLNVERPDEVAGAIELSVFDVVGRLRQTAVLREKTSLVDVQNLPAGAYVCVFRGGGKVGQQRIIIR